MNDNQFDLLRNFVVAKEREQNIRLRDADKFANRRSKYIWRPYISLHKRAEIEQQAKGINDLLADNKLAQNMFENDAKMRAMLLECSRLKNAPKTTK